MNLIGPLHYGANSGKSGYAQEALGKRWDRARGVLTLTWYTYMCLPFEVLFRKIWYSHRWVIIRGKGAQIQKLGVFWANYCKKHPMWAKLGAFLLKRYTDGWVIGRKIGIRRKSNFRGSAGTSTYNFGKSNPPGTRLTLFTEFCGRLRASIKLLSSLRLIGSAMFGATFNLVTRVRLPWFLEHWKMIVFKLIV